MASKILIMALLGVLVSLSIHAQNELEFSRVHTEKISGVGGVVTKSVTIPAGKVWKITSAFAGEDMGTAGVYGAEGQRVALTFNDISLYYNPLSSSRYYTSIFPIWVSEGTYNLVLLFGTPSGVSSCIGTMSVIEFNVK
ncbi:MAG: hypothetical protein KDC83_13425 [Flavobacteriales bacterium]|nr:hypothetical protein [Flavobacteriaceae bacterium]MCB0482423.1 hypothetical protein [Flavobacteriales bacterium]